jgi:hypothetical protein
MSLKNPGSSSNLFAIIKTISLLLCGIAATLKHLFIFPITYRDLPTVTQLAIKLLTLL